jgi:glycosyltransferase involved in cell wall biosynthesis
MKRVLVIAFFYPPFQTVGSVRPAALAKFLPQFGWEVTVLTPKREATRPESKDVIETGYRDVLDNWKARLRLDPKRSVHEQFSLPMSKDRASALMHTRLLNFARHLLSYPDQYRGWIPFGVNALLEIRRQNLTIDAVVTTSPPISSQLIGRQARNILRCPWIADFRDLWTQNLGESHQAFQRLQVGLEKRTLKDADALVTVSEPWARRLRQRYPNKKICTITNGFDPDDYSSPSPELTRDFSITYTGQLYAGQRDPSILFEALRDLLEENRVLFTDLRVRFYGEIEPWLPAMVQKYGLHRIVELNGRAPRATVMQRQRESQVLLLLPWSNPVETGHHSAKLFEYLAAGRPILAVGGTGGVLTEVLHETRAGAHASSKADAREFLLRAYSEYKKIGHVLYQGDKQSIERYSHPEMARRFAELLDSVTGGKDSGMIRNTLTHQRRITETLRVKKSRAIY